MVTDDSWRPQGSWLGRHDPDWETHLACCWYLVKLTSTSEKGAGVVDDTERPPPTDGRRAAGAFKARGAARPSEFLKSISSFVPHSQTRRTA
jgi:hypothetical protein